MSKDVKQLAARSSVAGPRPHRQALDHLPAQVPGQQPHVLQEGELQAGRPGGGAWQHAQEEGSVTLAALTHMHAAWLSACASALSAAWIGLDWVEPRRRHGVDHAALAAQPYAMLLLPAARLRLSPQELRAAAAAALSDGSEASTLSASAGCQGRSRGAVASCH